MAFKGIEKSRQLSGSKIKHRIIELVNEKFFRTNGGISLIELGLLLKIGQDELKTELNELYQEKKIVVRQGISHKLIYPYGK